MSIFRSFIHTIVALIIQVVFWFKHAIFNRAPISCRPSVIKRYPSLARLRPRIFFPLDYDPSGALKYPLFLEIHGGGFIMGRASVDDEYCSMISKECSAIVVSLDYAPSPQHQFPALSQDCIATIKAVLADPELPLNHKKVVIGGMSAGGNLALSIARDPEIGPAFKAMVIWYPIVDFTTSLEPRLKFRPKTDKSDGLVPLWPIMKTVYIPARQDQKDPALSPLFASAEAFPNQSYLIAAEEDILLYDTVKMAEHLAVGQTRQDLDSSSGLTKGWKTPAVTLCIAKQQPHAFNQQATIGTAQLIRRDTVDEVHTKLISWLRSEAFVNC